MSSSVALIAHTDLQSPFAWSEQGPVSAAQFLGDTTALAALLPEHPYVFNACKDRYFFTVAFAAALLRGQTCLLPPSQTTEMVHQLASQYPSLYCIADDPSEEVQLPCYFCHEIAAAPVEEVPRIASHHVAAIVFTSGSTGVPVAYSKTWGKLVLNAQAEGRRLGIVAGTKKTIVGTVPPQHMYGFESTVLVAMHNSAAFHVDKPFYPADICAALEQTPQPRLLVTTPFHLRTLLDDVQQLPPVDTIVCATAPLSPQLAWRAEQAFNAPLIEIYGCTESGQLATRRSTQTQVWETFEGAVLSQKSKEDRGVVSGSYIEGEVTLSDIIERQSASHFLLHGRSADMVNIAGKRSSLGFLNYHLNSIEGVKDAAFLFPEDDMPDGVQRLTAFVVAPSLSREQLLSALRERIDPVFLPRPLYFVDTLPRNSTSKLSRAALLDLERTLQEKSLSSPLLLKIPEDHPSFSGHFPGDPLLPGVVTLDLAVRAIEAATAWSLLPGQFSAVKFLAPVRPGAILSVEYERHINTCKFAVRQQTTLVATGVAVIKLAAENSSDKKEVA
ncbi:MAG: AMP-binding protein [Burkholderiaceae bacterium]|nr:AMP-binding protein [Burkholderiaceae bacterium]